MVTFGGPFGLPSGKHTNSYGKLIIKFIVIIFFPLNMVIFHSFFVCLPEGTISWEWVKTYDYHNWETNIQLDQLDQPRAPRTPRTPRVT